MKTKAQRQMRKKIHKEQAKLVLMNQYSVPYQRHH